jgi:hypothetical protein
MKKLALNIISISPQNVSILVLALAAAVWSVVWVILLTDIAKQSRSIMWKCVWFFLSTIPAVGGMMYAANELFCSDWGAALHWRKHDTKVKKNR